MKKKNAEQISLGKNIEEEYKKGSLLTLGERLDWVFSMTNEFISTFKSQKTQNKIISKKKLEPKFATKPVDTSSKVEELLKQLEVNEVAAPEESQEIKENIERTISEKKEGEVHPAADDEKDNEQKFKIIRLTDINVSKQKIYQSQFVKIFLYLFCS